MPLELSYASPLAAVDSILKKCLPIIDKNFAKNPKDHYKLISRELQKAEFIQLVNAVKNGSYYVNVVDVDNTLQNDKLLLQKRLNLLLDEVLKVNRKDYEIDYYNPEMFTKVGNNNLDIKDNLQTAALLYTL